MGKIADWLDAEVYPKLNHQLIFGDLPGFKRVGHNYIALCPLHSESKPSFVMKEGTCWGHCFGCGETLSWWRYYTDVKGMSTQEVVTELARLAGVRPVILAGVEEDGKIKEEIEKAEKTESWWQTAKKALFDDPSKEDVLNYLRSRGYTDEQIRLMDVGVTHPEPLPAGLKLPPPSHKLLIAIRSLTGRIIGFAGRLLGSGEPKYMYSKNVHKSDVLFGAYRLRKNDIPVIVEGMLDAEAIYAAGGGVRGVVALGGADISDVQVKIFKRYQKAILALDADDPGRKATEKAVAKLTAAGIKVYVIPDYAGSKDPDEFVRSKGVTAFADLARSAVAGHKWLLNRLLSTAGTTEIEKDRVLENVLDHAENLARTDPIAASELIQEAAKKLSLPEPAMAEAVERLTLKRRKERAEKILTDAVREAGQKVAEGKHFEATAIFDRAKEEVVVTIQEPPSSVDVVSLEREIANAGDGLLFPWPALNPLVRIDPGGMTTVYAASGFGKTNFLYNLMLYYLERYDGAIILWTGEMAKHRAFRRCLSILSGVDYAEIGRQIKAGSYTTEVFPYREKFVNFASRLYILEPLECPDTAALSSVVQNIARKQEITAVFVDYLQQLYPPGKADGTERYGTREQEITRVARDLHFIGHNFDIPLIAAVQINRYGGMQ
ncbi:MAG: toprim domain-containing protein, partial [Firmicutes bacterium]|nr:toprim domain-containing protein [Bacillota bacterium]